MRHSIGSAALLLFLFAAVTGCTNPSDTAAESPAVDAVEAIPVSFSNTSCPIMGGEPSADLTTEYDGQIIGFCCVGCPEKWGELSDAEKAETFAKVDAHAGHDHIGGEDDHSGHDVSNHPVQ